MLEFSDAPYRFFPPDPWPVIQWFGPQLNRILLKGLDHRIGQMVISGELDKIRSFDRSKTRFLFVANHPTRTDPQFLVEIQRRLGIRSSFMAAYDVFLENKIRAWFMQKGGSFSIDREGNDRKAMSTAIETLKTGDLALTIFPEGNVYLMNDRVTPFLDGTSFIAMKAHQALKGDGEVVVVPVSMKYSYLTDVEPKVWGRLCKLAEESGCPRNLNLNSPTESVVSVGSHILSRFLRERTEIRGDFDFTGLSPDEIQSRLFELAKRLIGDLEDELDLPRDDEIFVVDRIRKVRSAVHQIRINEKASAAMGEKKLTSLAKRSILGFRILAYVLPYLSEKPNLDRFAETVARLCEDFHSELSPPIGPRRALAVVGDPIFPGKIIEETGGKSRAVISELTKSMETAIANGIEWINQSNKTAGTKLVDEISSGGEES